VNFQSSSSGILLILASVVFSYWTYTLDLVQDMLDAYGIAYTRIDGKTSLLKRSEAISLFQNEHIYSNLTGIQ
jgi:SNF2 family DNA or RNA helicase